MNSKWKEVLISEIGEVKSGKRLPLGHSLSETPTRFPYIRLVDVADGRIQNQKLLYLDARTREIIKRYVVNTSDVCLAIVGHTIGTVFYVDEDFDDVNLTENAARITSFKATVNPRYVYYYLTSPIGKTEIQARKVGSAQGKLPLHNIKSFPLSIPCRKIQDEIVETLDSFNDRITLLRETNKTLESIAQAIFKSWFVDFDPVRAKMEGRQPEGMDEETAALFPDSFEESELGSVPRGWLPIRLDSFLELAYGKALKADNRNAGAIPVYGSGGVTGWHDSALCTSPSIIVGRKGTVGSLYWESRPFFPIDTVFYVKAKRPMTYCYQLLKTLGLHDMNTDAAVPGLNRENVYRLKAPDIPSAVLKAFDATAKVLRQSVDHNERRAQTLSSVRDTLLPRLISGQLRLPEAQEQIENAPS